MRKNEYSLSTYYVLSTFFMLFVYELIYSMRWSCSYPPYLHPRKVKGREGEWLAPECTQLGSCRTRAQTPPSESWVSTLCHEINTARPEARWAVKCSGKRGYFIWGEKNKKASHSKKKGKGTLSKKTSLCKGTEVGKALVSPRNTQWETAEGRA